MLTSFKFKKGGVSLENNVGKTELNVINNKVSVMIVNNTDYISLTDLARYANPEEPKIPIQTWQKNKDVVSFRFMGTYS